MTADWRPAIPVRTRRIAAFVFVAAMFLSVLSCNSGLTDSARIATLHLQPDRVIVAVGAVVPLTAIPRDGVGNAVTMQVVWTTSDPSIARVSSAGVVTAQRVGEVTIAASAQGVSGVARVTVSPKSVSSVRIRPTNASVRVGGTTQLVAEALDASSEVLPGRSMIWTTTDGSIATVDANGLVTGVAPGAATITATSEGRNNSAAVTVSLAPVASVTVSPSFDTLQQGTTRTLTATVRNDSGAAIAGRVVSWSSNNSQIASVTSTGSVTAVSPGKAMISATSEGKTGTAEVVVVARPVNSITVSPNPAPVTVGGTTTLTATLRDSEGTVLGGREVSWSSADDAIATVNALGVVTAISAGNVNITAASEGKSGTAQVRVTPIPVATVTVSPSSPTLLTDRTILLTATARSANGTVLAGRQVSWSSGSNSIATVNASGAVTGVAPGTTPIFAEVDGVIGSTNVTVERPKVQSVMIVPANPTIARFVGQVQLTAEVRDEDGNLLTDRAVVWSSSNELVVFVSASGLARANPIAILGGSAVITATVEGVSNTTTVTVSN